MSAQHDPGRSLLTAGDRDPRVPPMPPRRPGGLLLALALLLLALVHPLSWPGQPVPLWYPSAGIGLALVAWGGRRAAGLLLLAALLAGVRAALWPAPLALERWPATLGKAAYEGAWQSAMLATAWWAYRRGRGASDLRDPRSAVLFLLVPGGVLGLFAVLRTLPVWVASGCSFSLPLDAAAYWIGQALGVAALAPPLLVFAAESVGGGWWAVEGDERDFSPSAAHPGSLTLPFNDWLETGGLVLATTILSGVLAATQDPQALGSWQLWGAPLLLLVWAALRGGLRCATLVAAAGAVVALEVLARRRPELLQLPLLVQGNLLAQCCTALLVAASAGWVRYSEARYRRVVTQIPVVLYSARFLADAPTPRLADLPKAEVLFVSPPSVVVLGCPPEDLLGDYDRWLLRVHADDRELLLAALVQLSRQSQPVVCEYRLAPQPGEDPGSFDPARASQPPQVRWLRDTLVPHLDEGRLLGWEGMVSDITEQRVLADDLRRTTNMFHALVANLPAGVFFVSAKSGRPILVNQRARQLLGQREDCSAGLEHLSRVYRLHRADGSPYPVEELPVCQALRRGTVSMRDDIIVHCPDGRRVPLISWAAPVVLSQAAAATRGGTRCDAVVWVLEDLTDLRQAEAARHETEVRLRTVIESLAEGLVVQDHAGTIVDCNPAARALLGRLDDPSPGTAEGGGWLREDGSPLPADEHPVRRVLCTGIPVRNVVLGIRSGKSEIPNPKSEKEEEDRPSVSDLGFGISDLGVRWVLVNALPLAARAGTLPAGVVTTLADITDHVHAQHLLRASEERYRGLVDTLPLMVVQFDRHLRAIYVNPATCAITGYVLRDVSAPEAWQHLIHPEDLPAVLESFQEALAGTPGHYECRYRARDGQERVGYALLQPLLRPLSVGRCPLSEAVPSADKERPAEDREQPGTTDNGQRTTDDVVGVTALILDMTRQRRLERELERSQRLELVGRLSSGIAHDFNNLLTVVLGSLELARQGLADDHPVQRDLRRAAEVGDQAVALAQQILAFGKQSTVPLRPVEVTRTVRRALDVLKSLLPANVIVDSDLAEGDLIVQADAMQVQQVLMNLCLNARDAMPDGGRLSVRARAEGTLQECCLTVQDNGQGMSEEVRRRVFEPFFSTRERGTGLGMAVVQQIVTRFGGRIEVQSELGRGTRFDVWLPLGSGVRSQQAGVGDPG